MVATLDEVQNRAAAKRAIHKKLARQLPLIRLWANPTEDNHDGLVLRGKLSDAQSGSFPWSKNEPETSTIKLRSDHYLAKWLMSIPDDPNAKKNVVLTADFYSEPGKPPGMRWSGMLSHWTLRKDSTGIRFLEAVFVDDLQYLNFLLCPPNPLLPIPVFQWPRVLPIFGPTRWAISLLLLINIMRVEGNWWTLPDDPFNWNSWTESFDMTEWQVHIKANDLFSDSSLWTIFGVRMDAAMTAIKDPLDDAQQVLTYRRIITVDGETPADYGMDHLPHMRNGAVILEVVDRSGFYDPAGTAFGGGLIGGFVRSVVTFGEGYIDNTFNVVSDYETLWPDEYYQAGFYGQVPTVPWIVIRDSKWSQTATAELTWSPATAVSVVVGGDNPYVDQTAELLIQSIGNLLGYMFLGGFSSAGDIAATVIMPFLVGTILAWLQWKNFSRAQQLGWSHLFEIYQQGAEANAWSLAAFIVLRAGFRATESKTTHQFTMAGDGPIKPGLHLQIGDRIGSTYEQEFGPKIFTQHVEKMVYQFDFTSGDTAPAWEITNGRNEAGMSVAERQARQLSRLFDIAQSIGVHLLS